MYYVFLNFFNHYNYIIIFLNNREFQNFIKVNSEILTSNDFNWMLYLVLKNQQTLVNYVWKYESLHL